MKSLLHLLIYCLLRLRYKIEVKGLEKIREKGQSSILFMPNHPALIDPVIIFSILWKSFFPRPMADEAQVEKSLIRPMMKMVRAVVIPDLASSGRNGKDAVVSGLQGVIDGLDNGDNVLFYPAGRLYRSNVESLGGNSGAHTILTNARKARVVMIRTTGLWGSSFSRASGTPSLLGKRWKYIFTILANAIFFVPKRKVVVELYEPEALPVVKGRLEMNQFMESWYNEILQNNSTTPCFFWQGSKQVILPEPEQRKISHDVSHIPETTRQQVLSRLEEISGVKNIDEKSRLANDLAMDSLVVVELVGWLESEFGQVVHELEALETVADCMLAACGEMSSGSGQELKSVSEQWFSKDGDDLLLLAEGEKITDLFLNQAHKNPDQVIAADQLSGCKTYRQLIMAIFALRPMLAAISSRNVGIMLPASVSAVISWLALLFAEKIPVLVNWTTGIGQMRYCLENTQVTHVVTAKVLYEKLKSQGIDLDQLEIEWVFLDEWGRDLSIVKKITAFLQSRFAWRKLGKVNVQDTAAILFTSGSEANPKSVPLSHRNFVENCRDFSSVLALQKNDSLLGILPPFHSLGLAGTIIMPLVLGLRTVYSANPTEGVQLAKMISGYQTSLLLGTPTFLHGIISSATVDQLTSLRLVFTGAEKCPDYVYEELASSCPKTILCEGYGITECAPVVSLNNPKDPHPGTIGSVLSSMEYVIVHPETMELQEPGTEGMLLVRGPNVFSGYGDVESPSPFVEYDGRQWYSTGDLVSDNNGILVFAGRLKRFIKLGGEMISLPAIEAVLSKHFPAENDPVLAVDSTADEQHQEVVLFTTLDVDREEVNIILRQAGLSPLYNIRKIQKIANIPVLGTGKTNYRALHELAG